MALSFEPMPRATLVAVSPCLVLVVGLVVTSLISVLGRRQLSRSRFARPLGFKNDQSVSNWIGSIVHGARSEHRSPLLDPGILPRQLARLFACVLRPRVLRIEKDSGRLRNEKSASHLDQPSSLGAPTWTNALLVTAGSTASCFPDVTSGHMEQLGGATVVTSLIAPSPSSNCMNPTSPNIIGKRLLASGFWHGRTTPRVSSPLSTFAVPIDPLVEIDVSAGQSIRRLSPTTLRMDAPLPGFARPGFRVSRPPALPVSNKGLRLHAHGSGPRTVPSTYLQRPHTGPTVPAVSIIPAVIAAASAGTRNDTTVTAGIHPFAPPALHPPVPSHGTRPPVPIHPFGIGHDTTAQGALNVHPALSGLRVRTSNSSANPLSVTSPSSRVATTLIPAARPASLSVPTGSHLELPPMRSRSVPKVTMDEGRQGWDNLLFGPLPADKPTPTSLQSIAGILVPSHLPRVSGIATGLSIQTTVGRGF